MPRGWGIIGLLGLACALLVALVGLRKNAERLSVEPVAGEKERVEEVAVTRRTSPGAAGVRAHGRNEASPSSPERPRRQAGPAPVSGRILSGRVTLEDGSPLAGAGVEAASGTSTTADQEGRYQLTGLPDMVWRVTASHADGVSSSARRIGPDQTTLDFVLRRKQPVVLAVGAIHHATRQPIGPFTVSGGPGLQISPTVGPSGRYEITGVASGDEITFLLEAEGFAPRSVRERIPPDATGRVEKDYEMGNGAVVTGRLVRRGSREPVAGAGVLARSFARGRGDNAETSVSSGADGRFRLERLTPGFLAVEFLPEEPLVSLARPVGEIRHGQVMEMGEIQLGEGGTIRGRLLRVPGEEPVVGEEISLTSSGRWGWGRSSAGAETEAKTDAHGAFEFTRVPPGQYQVSAGRFEVRDTVSIQQDEEHSVTLRVGQGTLRGLILKEGHPVRAGVTFSRQSGGEVVAAVRTEEDGAFEISSLPPGLWKVNINPEGAPDVELEAEVPEQGVTEKVFVLPSGDIVGRVVDRAGKPVGGAMVSLLVSNPGAEYQARPMRTQGVQSGSDGAFRIADRPAGAVSLIARKEGVGTSPITDVHVPETGEAPEVVLRLGGGPTGTLVSTALNFMTGEPVPEAWCLLATDKGRVGHNRQRGADGVMTIPDLPVGTYQVQISASGYAVSEHTVTIREGLTESVTAVISPAGALRWTLVNRNGAGVGGVQCRLVPDDPASIEAPREGQTDATGLWSVRGLLPGAYTATAYPPGGATVSLKVIISANDLAQHTTMLE